MRQPPSARSAPTGLSYACDRVRRGLHHAASRLRHATSNLIPSRHLDMRAAIITRFGDPDVIEIRDVDTPTPGEFQVLVRIRASALNRADLLQRVGRYPAPSDSPKDIPGMELAGEVAAVGTSVSRWQLGDRVFGIA